MYNTDKFYESIEQSFEIDEYILEYDLTSLIVHRQSKSKRFEEILKRGP